MGLLSWVVTRKRKKLHRKLDIAIDQVKHGTYNILFMRYLERFDRDFSGNLAAAVTNALFSEKPVGKIAVDFLENNKNAVESELYALKGDSEIGFLVADAVQIRAMAIYTNQQSGAFDHNFGKSYDVLRKLNIIKKNNNVTQPKLFIIKAEKYFGASLKKVKYL